MRTAIWWIRRDLRLTDNQALSCACADAEQVIPLFVLDPKLLGSQRAGEKRTAFLFDGLRALDADIGECGGRLIVRSGDPGEVLAALCAESGAAAVYAERDYSPYAVARDNAITKMLPVPLVLTRGVTIRTPESTRKDDGSPYTVFTPYSRRWRRHAPIVRSEILPAPDAFAHLPQIGGEPIPERPALDASIPFRPGEAEAKGRLAAFVKDTTPPIHAYAQQRNLPELDGTSGLSPYLRFGMISPRQAALAAYAAIESAPNDDARTGADTWLTELIWRDFYISILHHFPHVSRGSFHRVYDAIAWSNDQTCFDAWCAGQTGYPFIDAAMRQLASIGWMHNRARMVV
ncbi:MAG: deoxyribodipyrimidine photo-lyase, partial [Caldilinea sp.]